MQEINVKELYKKMENDDFRKTSIVVDVRVPGEFRSRRIPSSINIQLDKLNENTELLSQYDHVYLHCETGGRSSTACDLLESASLDNWANIDGGILAWVNAGLPVITSHNLSLQRQIMITAGLLILTGTLLSFWKTGFIGLAIFVGAGLTFAGITNHCGMALVLQKMPWNQKPLENKD